MNQAQAALRASYAEAERALRSGRLATAERLLIALRAVTPGEVNCLRLLAITWLQQGKAPQALDLLERIVATAPGFVMAHVDRVRACRAVGRIEAAHAESSRLIAAHPQLQAAWLAHGDVLVELERYQEARAAFDKARATDPFASRIEAATAALVAEDRKTAESIFREILTIDASHIAAVCGLAAISLTVGRGNDAARLLQHAQRQCAHLPLTWRGLCQAMTDLGRLSEAEAAVRQLLKIEPENPANWVALGNVCTRLMRQAEALTAFTEAARLNPGEIRLRLSIGHLHKTLGHRAESEAAYHACLQLDPKFAEAYWSLADLKNYYFTDVEVSAMHTLDARDGGDDADQAQLQFALGRALEQRKCYAAAFDHYARGNARRRKTLRYDIRRFEDKTRRVASCFDRKFFAARARVGCPEPVPIFIVGLPRSGSTLVEQILASHSQVEGTFELPNVLTIVREFDHANPEHDAYPESVCSVPAAHFAELGRRYLAETAPIRCGHPRFIDKMPNNFSHVGLIHCLLPNATIVDVRRQPMDACFSTFKQHFAEGQSFSYDLDDLGRYYRSYLTLMDHWDDVLPGKVLHLSYESLVHSPEANIRRLLAHCQLDFEAACTSFHETRRPVRTASAEQVRQPMYTSGVGYWTHFATQLEPLRRALGDRAGIDDC